MIPALAQLMFVTSLVTITTVLALPGCQYSLIVPSPPTLHCEQQGTLSKSQLYMGFVRATLADCRNSCLADKACISFAYGTGPQACALYSASLDAQRFKQSNSGVIYSNRHCYLCNRVTSTSTTSTTSTTSSTSTTTATPIPTAQQCGLDGVQFAVWQASDGQDNDDPESSNFGATDFQQYVPQFVGTTDTIGGFDIPYGTSSYDLYNEDELTQFFITINHQGYFFAPTTGNYIWTLQDVDNVAYLWIGNTANTSSDWTVANPAVACSLSTTDSASSTVSLTAGTYTPFRIVYGNGVLGAQFSFQITGPDGTTYNPTSSTGNIVQYSCDMTTAPPFPDYGTAVNPYYDP